MADEGVRDYRKAKQKACLRLGVSMRSSVPTNLEIEDALGEQLSIFLEEPTEKLQQRYLETALSVMQLFTDEYSPKLTGAALSGVITAARPVELHVFPLFVEQVTDVLDRASWRYDMFEKRKRFTGKVYRNIPGFEMALDDVAVEIYCFCPGVPYPPLDFATGKPIKSISRKRLKRTLDISS